MNIPNYSPSELVRIELLRYDNPEGLHPVEAQWRDLASKLLEHIEDLQREAAAMYKVLPCYHQEKFNFMEYKFPQKFTPNTGVVDSQE